MVDMSTYWPIVIALGIGTFLIRFSFILIVDRVTFPDAVQRGLRFIPASVLTALIVPSVLLTRGAVHGFAGWDRTLAALVAVGVAWKTRNIFVTIASGMAALWLLRAVL